MENNNEKDKILITYFNVLIQFILQCPDDVIKDRLFSLLSPLLDEMKELYLNTIIKPNNITLGKEELEMISINLDPLLRIINNKNTNH